MATALFSGWVPKMVFPLRLTTDPSEMERSRQEFMCFVSHPKVPLYGWRFCFKCGWRPWTAG